MDEAESFASMRAAQARWAATPLDARLAVIRQLRYAIVDRLDEAARASARTLDRTTLEALAAEILPLIDACRFLERQAQAILRPRRSSRRDQPVWIVTHDYEVQRSPWGLVLILAPSNYLLFIPAVQTLQALVAGNAVLLKPGTGGSAAAQCLAQWLSAAGLPASLLRVLPDSAEAGVEAIEAGVDKVVMTGSAPTGIAVLTRLAPRLVPATLELSGSDAVLVRADADLDLVVRAVLFGFKLNRGATCIAPRRVFVHTSRAADLQDRLVAAVQQLPEARIEGAHNARLFEHLRAAESSGAQILCGRISGDATITGPLLVARVQPDMPLLNEAYFAAVLMLISIADDEAALAAIAGCPYALGASVFSADEQAACALAGRIPAGFVSINDLIVPSADARLPFGGRGRSGYGVTRGAEGLLEMTLPKVIAVSSGHWRPHFDEPREGDEQGFRNFILAAHGKGFSRRVWAALCLIYALVYANLIQHRRRRAP
jgi:acyl-CoA reductase-like NAD-dependent aldehyde dehydrogenase